MRRIKNIHFVGIGGSGMSGIAEVLLNQGYTVTGSDKSVNTAVTRLRQLGAQIFDEHVAANVANADVVVISSAIDAHNPEVVAAKLCCVPVLPRAQMLAELMRLHYGIAIAGTHGKTTTTSLVASTLAAAGMDPTFVIGGLLNSAGSHAYLGKSRYFVVEADESDASFLYLNPMLSVITNIDEDHMHTYGHDFAKLKEAFIAFAQRLPFYGVLIACIDDANVKAIVSQVARPVITYGFNAQADVQGLEYEQCGWQTRFKVKRNTMSNTNGVALRQQHASQQQPLLEITLNLPGKHNALNALAVIAIASELEISDAVLQTALRHFGGVGRRLQVHGDLHLPRGRALLIDDYGHHPAEIAATLQAVRAAWPQRRIVLAFQPHRYTRTHAMFNDFARALAKADILLLLDIYAAGEESIPGVTGRSLADNIRRCGGGVEPIFIVDVAALLDIIPDVLGDNDVLLLQGAGNIGVVPQQLLAKFGNKAS